MAVPRSPSWTICWCLHGTPPRAGCFAGARRNYTYGQVLDSADPALRLRRGPLVPRTQTVALICCLSRPMARMAERCATSHYSTVEIMGKFGKCRTIYGVNPPTMPCPLPTLVCVVQCDSPEVAPRRDYVRIPHKTVDGHTRLPIYLCDPFGRQSVDSLLRDDASTL